MDGIDESIEADFGEYSGALGGGFAVDIKHDTGRHIVSGDFVGTQHLPDLWRLGRRGAGGVRASNDASYQSWFGDVINAFDARHIACRDGVQHGEISRVLFAVEAFAESFQNASGQQRPEEELTVTVAPSAIFFTASVALTILGIYLFPRIRSAALSAMAMVGALVFEEIMQGMVELSQTRRPSIP